MEQSEHINELAAALSKSQEIIQGAHKDSANPFFKCSYADLASVWDACKSPLSKNGLAVVQTTDFDETTAVIIITTLLHSSGQWIRGKLKVTPVKSDPQALGSAITYGRRYALSAIVGVAPIDDDGNAASGKTPDTDTSNKEQKAVDINKIMERFEKCQSIPELDNSKKKYLTPIFDNLSKKEQESIKKAYLDRKALITELLALKKEPLLDIHSKRFKDALKAIESAETETRIDELLAMAEGVFTPEAMKDLNDVGKECKEKLDVGF